MNRIIIVGREKNPTLPCCMEQEERGKHPFLAHPTDNASRQERCVLLFLSSLSKPCITFVVWLFLVCLFFLNASLRTLAVYSLLSIRLVVQPTEGRLAL
jgi:hypothetical protein